MVVPASKVSVIDRPEVTPAFARFASEHASRVLDEVFAERVRLFTTLTTDPEALWRGELGAVPQSYGSDANSLGYFDRLVTEGDPSSVATFINADRLRERVASLDRARATGDMRGFLAIARELHPGGLDREHINLARLLWEAEYQALCSLDETALAKDPIVSAGFKNPETVNAAKSAVPPISLDELRDQWERETNPSAATLCTWRQWL